MKPFIITMMIIVTIIVIILIVWAVQKKKAKEEKNKKVIWPPNDYMQSVGSKCPDYWTYIGNDSKTGKVMCQNKFNIPVANAAQFGMCYDDVSGYDNVKLFNKIEKWPIPSGSIDNQLVGNNYSFRCNWIKNCGPTDKTSASWLGIKDMCSNI